MIEVKAEPGWVGNFTRFEAPGGFKNGSRVVKTQFPKGDVLPLGSLGTVLGSLPNVTGLAEEVAADMGRTVVGKVPAIGYFVEWDQFPKHALFVSYFRVALAEKENDEHTGP